MKIFVARHGQDVDNENGILNGHRDLELTEKGRQQAEKLGKYLKSLGIVFDYILASPLERAKKLLYKIEKNFVCENILLVCHGDIGKMLYAAFYGLDWEVVLNDFYLGNLEILVLDRGIGYEDAHIVF